MILDLAHSSTPHAELAEKYGISVQGVKEFAKRNKPAIAAIREDAANELAGLWGAIKRARIADAMADIEDIEEQLQDALNHQERHRYMSLKAKIRHALAEECGQLPSRTNVHIESVPHLTHTVEGIDMERALGIVRDPRAAAVDSTHVEPSVDLGDEADTMRELFRANPPPTSEPEPAVAPTAPVLPDDAARAGRALAQQVWSTGVEPYADLFAVGNEVAQAEASAALTHAISERWIAVSGDMLVRGAVSPNPMEALPTENSPAWGSSRV